MNPYAVYSLFLLFLLAGSLLVIFNFVRYRFTGDLTYTFIVGYFALAVLTIVITLSIIPVGSV